MINRALLSAIPLGSHLSINDENVFLSLWFGGSRQEPEFSTHVFIRCSHAGFIVSACGGRHVRIPLHPAVPEGMRGCCRSKTESRYFLCTLVAWAHGYVSVLALICGFDVCVCVCARARARKADVLSVDVFVYATVYVTLYGYMWVSVDVYVYVLVYVYVYGYVWVYMYV